MLRLRRSTVKRPWVLLLLMLSANSTGAIAQEIVDSSNSNVLIVHGVLSRNGKAGTLWTLKAQDSPKFRGEMILEVTFTTRVGEASRTYVPYDEKFVELSGEVKSVFHGNAVLSKVRSIGMLESPAAILSAYANLGAVTTARAVSTPNSIDRTPYKHAYYLFLADVPNGCEACYVPLLISQHSLKEIANGGETMLCVFIFTYERDSIWEIKGAVPVDSTSIEAQPQIIHVNGRSYRYQEISPNEVLKLLQEPDGTIPISRPLIVNKMVPGASVSDLIGDFRGLLSVDGTNQK
jgi:hypothetical protein